MLGYHTRAFYCAGCKRQGNLNDFKQNNNILSSRTWKVTSSASKFLVLWWEKTVYKCAALGFCLNSCCVLTYEQFSRICLGYRKRRIIRILTMCMNHIPLHNYIQAYPALNPSQILNMSMKASFLIALFRALISFPYLLARTGAEVKVSLTLWLSVVPHCFVLTGFCRSTQRLC